MPVLRRLSVSVSRLFGLSPYQGTATAASPAGSTRFDEDAWDTTVTRRQQQDQYSGGGD